MPSSSAVPPSFHPGSGWYRPGHYSPGSLADRKGKRDAAFPCTVVVLRRRGERFSATELLLSEPPSGFLVCQDDYTFPKWYASLFAEPMQDELLPRLLHVRLERENVGVRLYGGIQVDAQARQEFRQAWLCAPTPERAREILLAMEKQEHGKP